MISRDAAMVSIECDAPGCNRSHTLPNQPHDNTLDKLLRKVATEGWLVVDGGHKILHLCPKCGSGKQGSQPLMSHIRPDGSLVNRGSMDITGMLTGVIVSAQQVRAEGQTIPAGTVVTMLSDGTVVPAQSGDKPIGVIGTEESRKLRQARRRDELNGTPGLSELPEEKRKELAAKLEEGKRVFKLTIDLREGKD